MAANSCHSHRCHRHWPLPLCPLPSCPGRCNPSTTHRRNSAPCTHCPMRLTRRPWMNLLKKVWFTNIRCSEHSDSPNESARTCAAYSKRKRWNRERATMLYREVRTKPNEGTGHPYRIRFFIDRRSPPNHQTNRTNPPNSFGAGGAAEDESRKTDD